MASFSYNPGSFRTLAGSPFPHASSTRNSPGLRTESVASQGSSLPTVNELDGGKSSPGALSSYSTRNEDHAGSTTEHSYVGGSGIPRRDSDLRRPIPFTDFNAPSSQQNSGFRPAESSPTSFPSGIGQPHSTAGYAAAISIFCHECGLSFRGLREEALEALDYHRCMRPINGGYANDYFPPLNHTNGRPSRYREEYIQPNQAEVGPSMMAGLPPVANHGHASSYFDRPHQPVMNQHIYRPDEVSGPPGHTFSSSYFDEPHQPLMNQHIYRFDEVSGPPDYTPSIFNGPHQPVMNQHIYRYEEVSGPPAPTLEPPRDAHNLRNSGFVAREVTPRNMDWVSYR